MSGGGHRHIKGGLRNYGTLYAFPMGLWFTLFFIFPLLIIAVYSFLQKGLHGGVVWNFTLKAYSQMFVASYGKLFVRTLLVTIVSTALCILIALPCGYAMAKSKHQTLLLFLIIIPFWTNSLIRINAWIGILGNEGVINEFLLKIGFIKEEIQFLYNQNAVILVLVYMFLPYAILPIFTAIDKFDFALLEAARDLGATKSQSLIKVMLPNIQAGIITAFIFTFIPIFGTYTVPLFVGGKDSYMIGNVIVDQATKIGNWPLAASISMVITVLSTAGVLLMMAFSSHEEKKQKDRLNREREAKPLKGEAGHGEI